MASSGMTRKDMAQMFKKIGWKRKEESAPPPTSTSQPAVSIESFYWHSNDAVLTARICVCVCVGGTDCVTRDYMCMESWGMLLVYIAGLWTWYVCNVPRLRCTGS